MKELLSTTARKCKGLLIEFSVRNVNVSESFAISRSCDIIILQEARDAGIYVSAQINVIKILSKQHEIPAIFDGWIVHA